MFFTVLSVVADVVTIASFILALIIYLRESK